MTTARLLWGMKWRGGAWGLLAGTLLGSAYGAVFAVVVDLYALSLRFPYLGEASDAPRALVGALFLALVGAIIGALFGVPTGLLVGASNGLLLGVLTRALFYPLKDARIYRRVVALVSAVFAGIAAWVCFVALALFYANRSAANVDMIVVIVAIPALIAGVSAGFISRFIARWYERNPISNF
jgi:hypothetical protein